MSFKKIENKFSDSREISGFWTRKEGESITGKVTKLVDTVNVKYPFFLVELTESGATINHEDKEVPGIKGQLIAVMASAGLKPLNELVGQVVRVTATGSRAVTFKDERGRKKPGTMLTFDIEVDEEAPPF
jgi:hypothetical protein